MTSAAKAGLLIGALAIAVVGFIALRPDDNDDNESAPVTEARSGETTTESGTPAPEQPKTTGIRIRGSEVVGGAPDIEVTKGDRVRIIVRSDAPDELHLHGYDISREAGPGKPARFVFSADLEGAFELESHTAEDAGKDPIVARLAVRPS